MCHSDMVYAGKASIPCSDKALASLDSNAQEDGRGVFEYVTGWDTSGINTWVPIYYKFVLPLNFLSIGLFNAGHLQHAQQNLT